MNILNKMSNFLFGDNNQQVEKEPEDKTRLVVYNKFDYDSLMAAALYKSLHPEVKVVDNTKSLSTKYDEYLWLGITPSFEVSSDTKFIKDKVSRSVVAVKSHEGEVEFAVSVFMQVAQLENKVDSRVMTLVNLLNQFHTNTIKKAELVFVYKSLKMAQEVIDGSSEFLINETITDYDAGQFDKYIKLVKQRLEGNYNIRFIELKSKYARVVMTTFSDDYHWVLRLIKLGHKNHVNLCLTTKGCMVETNLPSIAGMVLDSHCYRSINI